MPGVKAKGREWRGLIPAGYSLLLAAIVLGPLLGPGYLLLRDAVSTPRSYLTDSALGLGDAAPRAVPQDALIATLSPVVDGGIIVKAIVLAALWLEGWGAAALARDLLRASLAPQLVAATVTVWNPYVAERLLQGHWSLLTGYAALPWIALLCARLREAPPSGTLGTWAALTGCLAVAGLTPTGSLLAGLVAIILVGKRNLPATVALWILSAAPWLTATALSSSGAAPSDPAGVAAFAARAEPWLGTLGSLAGLGGIWNSTAVPDSRTTFFALVGTILLLAVVATGLRAVLGPGASGAPGNNLSGSDRSEPAAGADRDESSSDGGRIGRATGSRTARTVRRRLVWLAVAAVVLPALGATGWGLAAGEFLVTRVPGAGLLRDTQKYAALAVPAYALCAAAGCRTVARWVSAMAGNNRVTADARATATMAAATTTDTDTATAIAAGATTIGTPAAGSGRTRMAGAAALLIGLILLALPDLAWGVGGALRPVHYPAGWERVAALVDGTGDVAVLPGGMFRKFGYSGDAPVLDPAPRMLRRDVLQTGELPVRGGVVAGEGQRARRVEKALSRGTTAEKLADLGVGWVLVEGRTPGPLGESKATLAQLDPVYSDSDLQLYRVPGDIATNDASPESRQVSGAAHLLWAVLLVGGLLTAATISGRRSILGEAERESDPDHDDADERDDDDDPHSSRL
ncbi:hypothetical protein NSK11_contig00011-0068 [Nocardia seriolae]|uniref:Transmembrane protein n=1 Tax=Nocardia seriolae TaxID=37332 RepID=A0ABC9YND2_9NOCA|nr:hypothetical protein NSER024013_72220 [Nocardia seriolae]GAM44878.1 hypothetical protein NS07_v2contig00009-0036 [Nocardia seriolae]GAP26931.1 hypothetical protein NSK11_contig00011-0068 [Nocardia seriolae]